VSYGFAFYVSKLEERAFDQQYYIFPQIQNYVKAHTKRGFDSFMVLKLAKKI